MAEANGTYSAEQVERLLTCAVCLDRFNSPKILPCQHTFCKSPCLEGLIDMRTRVLRCPECRSEHFVPREGADGYPTNITLSGFLDLPANRSATPSGRRTAQPEPGSPGKCGVCEAESQTARCFHCEKLVCESCKRSHAGQMKVEIGRSLNQIRREIPQLSNSISSVEQKSEQMKTRVDSVKSEITDTVERYSKELKDRQKMLQSELDTYLQGELRSLRLHQESIEVQLASIASYCDSTEGMVSQADNNIPEADLLNIKKQCDEYLEQIHNAENNPVPELREVNFSFDGQPVHSSITNLGEIHIITPSTSNRNSGAPTGQAPQIQPSRGRWSDTEPMDIGVLESFRVSPAFSYASLTPRAGRRSHSPPTTRSTNRTMYTRPTQSSVETGLDSRLRHGFHPSQTLPTQRNFPSRTNDYMFSMNSPSSGDLLDIMDRNRQEEINRRRRGGARARNLLSNQPRQSQERAAGFMGGGGGGLGSVSEFSAGSPYNIVPQINTGTGSVNPSVPDSHGTNLNVSQAVAEAAERRARNTALTRNTDSRPPAAFVIPLDGGPVQTLGGSNTAGSSADNEHTEAQPVSSPPESQGQDVQITEPGEQQTPQTPQSEQQTQPEPAQAPVQETPQSQQESQQTPPQQPDVSQVEPSQIQGQPQQASEHQEQSNTQPRSQDHGSSTSQPATPQQPAGPQVEPSQSSRQPQASGNRQQPNSQPRRQNQRTSTGPRRSSHPSSRSQEGNSNRRRRGGRSQSNNTSSSRETGSITTRVDTGGNNSNRRSGTNENSMDTSSSGPQSTSSQQPTASSSSPRRAPPSLGPRSGTFVQESGPSTSTGNIPRVNGMSSTYDIPLTETLGDLNMDELSEVTVDNSPSVARPIINYQTKGTAKLQIGGERGNQQGRFTWPRGVAVSPVNDSIVVADSSNHRAQMFDLTGHFVSVFGSYGQGDAEFDCLAGVAIDRTGQIIIADRYNHRIQVFDRYGEFSHQFGQEGNGNGQMNYPWGVAVDRGGFIYVCDKENHRIQVFQGNGTFVRKFGSLGSRAGQMENPHYVAVGFDGNVYVSDCSNHRIQVFSDTGRFIRSVGTGEGSANGQLKNPKGVAVDRQGFIVIADSGNNRIQVFRGDGRFFCAFGAWGTGSSEFKGMEGIAVSSQGDIVVSDKENHRIQIF